MPMVAVAMSLVVLSGCGTPIACGEMRRRELFRATLLAGVFGRALIWWWSSRRRRRPPPEGDDNPGEFRLERSSFWGHGYSGRSETFHGEHGHSFFPR